MLMVFALLTAHANAGSYPSYECASEKMEAAAQRCDKVLKAWSIWALTEHYPDWLVDHADRAFDGRWTRAEYEAGMQGVDCAEMTLSAVEMRALMDGAIGEIVSGVTDGLDLGITRDGICGLRVLNSAASLCRKLLRAESKHIEDLSRDPEGKKLEREQERAARIFGHQWNQATRRHCSISATEEEIEGKLMQLNDDVVTNITISPNVPDDAFVAITHPAGGEPGNEVIYEGDTLVPQCQDGSPFTFFAKRGTVNKLLMYYYGGGACWDTPTCVLQTCTQNVDPTPPGLGGSGFGDLTDPDNPFKDWHVVRVPYCSCDIHLGDNAVDYPPIPDFGLPGKRVEHRGHDNAKLAEKWAREHFLNPADMFVTGSSAGSYGAMVHGVHLSGAYVATSINVMGDGGNGVVTQEFMDNSFNNWGALLNLPEIPGIIGVPASEMTIPLILKSAASYYPDTNWSNYTTAFDGGGGGQTGFFNVMLNPLDPAGARETWWEASCLWNEIMREQAYDTAAATAMENDNYRYYIATGSRHTGFSNPRVYDDTTGGVPTLADWVNAMIDDAPGWNNVEADPFNVLFPGECSDDSDNPGARCNLNADCPNGSCVGDDVKPDPLMLPFEMDDTGPEPAVVVNCP
jgi:hypothetical protein